LSILHNLFVDTEKYVKKIMEKNKYKNPAVKWYLEDKDIDRKRGKYFPGIFCEVVNCLIENYFFIKEKEINLSVLSMLKNKEKENKPVTLWTAYGWCTNLKEIMIDLKEKWDIEYPVVCLYDFRWCMVEEAIDRLSPKRFIDIYRILPCKYYQVNEYGKISKSFELTPEERKNIRDTYKTFKEYLERPHIDAIDWWMKHRERNYQMTYSDNRSG